MDLRTLIGVLHKYWMSIVVCVILGAALAIGFLQVRQPVYTARSQVFLSVGGGTTASDLSSGANFANTVAQSYTKIVSTAKVLDPVIQQLGLKTTSATLATHVSTSVAAGTSFISIAVTNSDPQQAADIAESAAENFQDAVADIAPKDANAKATVVITILSPATVPTAPTSPNRTLVLLVGILGGFAVGIAQAVLRKTTDISIRSESDVTKATEHSVLARIPFSANIPKDPLSVVNDPMSPVAEEYRRLRTNLSFVTLETAGSPIFIVTSSVASEGKSVTAINIAFSYAEAGQRVLLIDADLRRPRIASYLNLEGSVGLTTVLVGKAKMSEVIQKLGPGHLDVLPLGLVPPNPVEMSGSDAMRRLLTTASQLYEVVIVDAAPLLPVTDSTLLASMASGTLIVAGAGKVHIPELHDAVAMVEQGDAKVLGIILTQVKRDPGNGYYYRSNYYGYADSGTQKGASTPEAAAPVIMPAAVAPRTAVHAEAPRRGA
jgi:capsular exopolysaccharide synthesis family protein